MLEKNLRAIAQKNPTLASKILEHKYSGIDVAQTESGDYNIIFNNTPIHNTSNPQKEAKEIFGEKNNNDNSIYLLFGLGLGYLFKRTYIDTKGTIVIFDPSIDILRFTLENVDFSEELTDNRVFLIDNEDDLAGIFIKYLYDEARMIHLTPYFQIYPTLYEKIFHTFNMYYIDQRTNVNKSIEIAQSYTRSLPNAMRYPSVEVLENKFKDMPAVVVSAGPSLDGSIEYIKNNRNKFILISIGQAIKALKENDIIPDFAVIIDSIRMDYQLTCLKDDINKINLVIQASVDENTYQLPTKTKFVYHINHNYMSEWFTQKAGYKTYFPSPTVSICAFNLAILMGCSTVILVGQNLAYSNGKIYAKNSIYDSLSYNVNDKGKLSVSYKTQETDDKNHQNFLDQIIQKNSSCYENVIYVKGQDEVSIPTLNSYASFITYYTKIVKDVKINNPDITLINSSTGGAFIDGFDHKPIQDALNSFTNLKINIDNIINSVFKENKPNYERFNTLVKDFINLSIDLKALIAENNKIINLSNSTLKDIKYGKTINKKVVESYNKLQNLNSGLNKYLDNNRISFIYPYIQKELFEHSKIKDKQEKDDLKKVINEVTRIKVFSEALKVGSERTLEELNKIEDFKEGNTK